MSGSSRSVRSSLLMGAGALIGAGLAARAIVRSRRFMDLHGRTVVITGGSRGLGLNLARLCVERGANVAICSRDLEELERGRADLMRLARGTDVLAVQCDVMRQDQVDAFIRGVVGSFGAIDVLVNNAGVIQVGPMEEMTLADYEEAMATHFYAPLYTTLAALPVMRARRDGRIVNIASIGGKVAAPHLLPYTASKFALVGFSEGLRVELAKYNIFVTTVVPGLFRSGSPRNALFKGKHQEEYAWFAASDTFPVLSMSVQQLARRILSAAQHGQAELITPFATKLQVKGFQLMPALASEVTTLINAMLPSPGGIGRDRVRGSESESSKTPAYAQATVDRTARENNEVL